MRMPRGLPEAGVRGHRRKVEAFELHQQPAPTAYLTNEAGCRAALYVDERCCSAVALAELIASHFEPWLVATGVRRILELGTGSGCIAVALALAFPGSRVVATDISADALAVAAVNVDRHAVADRVELIQADLYAGLQGRFDLIVSNPPYVPEDDVKTFPPEYGHEPRLALVSGSDGMATPARILHHAARFLTPQGWLALEVGAGVGALEARFPTVPRLARPPEGGKASPWLAPQICATACPRTNTDKQSKSPAIPSASPLPSRLLERVMGPHSAA
jgi:ribosomal protein L3 glutamine methyltransferase